MASRVSKWRQRNLTIMEMLHDSDASFEEVEEVEEQSSSESLIDNDRMSDLSQNDTCYPDTSDSESFCCDNEEPAGALNGHRQELLIADIASWSVENSISHQALSGLLKVLRVHCDPELPCDPRTVLKTPRNVDISKKCGGDYVYLGIVSGILRQGIDIFSKEISLVVNVDGLPLFKSSNSQVWPILGKVNGSDPFIIALFYGQKKPDNLVDYLDDFNAEVSHLTENGLELGNDKKSFKLLYFTCDAPARQFLKCIKGHTGYHSCERCTVEGERHSNTTVFNDTNAELRTDEQFNVLNYPYHQHQLSVLAANNFPCVSSFVLDYMHLICLGVVKRMLTSWKDGQRAVKLSNHQLDIISNKLLALRNDLPSEFARKPRSLNELGRWKATELKQFLLYTGLPCIKGIVSSEIFQPLSSP